MADHVVFTKEAGARIATAVRVVERSSRGDLGRGRRRIPIYTGDGGGDRWAMATGSIAAGSAGTVRYYTVSGGVWTSTSSTDTALNWTVGTSVASGRRLIVGYVDGTLAIKHYDCP